LRKILVRLVALGCAGSCAFAEWQNFVPRPSQNGAFFDLFGSYESDDLENGSFPFTWADTFFREKVTLYSNGYVYHPRFLQYHAAIAGALKQEDYRASSFDSQGWTGGTGLEYDTKLFFLPEHPYSAELFALRYEPLFKEQSATQHNNIQTSWGGAFRYRVKPWLFNAGYNSNTIESGVSTSNVDRLSVGGEHLMITKSGYRVSTNAAYNPSRFSNSSGLEGSATESLFGNVVDVKRVRLTSTLSSNDSDQEGDVSGRYTTDQFVWYELLNLYLPLNFRSNVTYRYQDNDSTLPGGINTGARALSDLSRNFQFEVLHRLYQNLDTVYTFLDHSRESSGGDTSFRANSLSLNYNKLIPRGRVLAGVGLARGNTDNQGRADVVNEPHLATPVPGFFNLVLQNVDQPSLAIYLKSPIAPYQMVRLTLNLHYTLTLITNVTQVTIIALPPAFVVPGTYDFFASYSLVIGDFGMRTDTLGYNASVELFDTMLTPYYSYGTVQSDVTAGTFPGIPLDSKTRTAGVLFHRGPWRARGEYQNVQWEVSPFRAWKGELQYVGSLNPTTRLYATGTYVNKYFPEGTTVQLGEAYTDSTIAASGSIQKQLPPRSLSLSAGGTWSRLRGIVDTDAYAVNASVLWKIGKLDFSAGASIYGSDTSGGTGFDNNRFHEYYYFNIRRILF
jgi:hypothetical protein